MNEKKDHSNVFGRVLGKQPEIHYGEPAEQDPIGDEQSSDDDLIAKIKKRKKKKEEKTTLVVRMATKAKLKKIQRLQNIETLEELTELVLEDFFQRYDRAK